MDYRKKALTNNPYAVRKKVDLSNVDPTSWEKYFDSKEILDNGLCCYRVGKEGTPVILLHGAGMTALSWSIVAHELGKKSRVVAYDCRGHGDSTCDASNLSADTLVADLMSIVALFPGEKVMLAGHSMGGAIVARAASTMTKQQLALVVVVDVVEGTALEALPRMNELLAKIPKKFRDVPEAINWAVTTEQVRNVESACISIPSQIKPTEEGHYVWKVQLDSTGPFWQSWFDNLSKVFLMAPVPKLLILASTNRLDNELTVAQMQGKFQMKILQNVGHTIQEDDPVGMCEAMLQFMNRFGYLK